MRFLVEYFTTEAPCILTLIFAYGCVVSCDLLPFYKPDIWVD